VNNVFDTYVPTLDHNSLRLLPPFEPGFSTALVQYDGRALPNVDTPPFSGVYSKPPGVHFQDVVLDNGNWGPAGGGALPVNVSVLDFRTSTFSGSLLLSGPTMMYGDSFPGVSLTRINRSKLVISQHRLETLSAPTAPVASVLFVELKFQAPDLKINSSQMGSHTPGNEKSSSSNKPGHVDDDSSDTRGARDLPTLDVERMRQLLGAMSQADIADLLTKAGLGFPAGSKTQNSDEEDGSK